MLYKFKCCSFKYMTFCTVHIHRKVLSKSGVKLFLADEENKWAVALKKMNAYIRYLRMKKKNTD